MIADQIERQKCGDVFVWEDQRGMGETWCPKTLKGSNMHGFIARPRFSRPFDDEEERRVLAELVPICKRSGGFRALYTLRLSDREIVNIFFWDTREEAERGFAAARPRILELLSGILEGPPDRVSGELIFSYPGDPGHTEG